MISPPRQSWWTSPVDGRPIKALAQVSKQAFAYVLDRETGKPVWPIEERPVPQTPAAPGEHVSPTQPIPTKPAAFDQQGITDADLIDFTPALKAEARRLADKWSQGPLFMPVTLKGTLSTPGWIGGASWAGATVDPKAGILYVPSVTLPTGLGLQKPAEPSAYPYEVVVTPFPEGPQGLPLTKPPYGRVTAIDLNTGDNLWVTPMGKGPKNHPALAGLNLPDLGWPYRTFVVKTPSPAPGGAGGTVESQGLVAPGECDLYRYRGPRSVPPRAGSHDRCGARRDPVAGQCQRVPDDLPGWWGPVHRGAHRRSAAEGRDRGAQTEGRLLSGHGQEGLPRGRPRGGVICRARSPSKGKPLPHAGTGIGRARPSRGRQAMGLRQIVIFPT